MAEQFILKLGIDPEKLYRATSICQYGLCCCNRVLVSFRLFHKNLCNLRDFFGQMVNRPPWQKISRTPMFMSSLISLIWLFTPSLRSFTSLIVDITVSYFFEIKFWDFSISSNLFLRSRRLALTGHPTSIF